MLGQRSFCMALYKNVPGNLFLCYLVYFVRLIGGDEEVIG